MKVFIIGGTGFIGYHAVLEFLKRGHQVSTLALPPLPEDDLLPVEVDIRLVDINELSDDAVQDIFDGQDALVFAAGADDRTIPKAPAYEFFYDANVRVPQRLFRLAREVGVKRGVILGSYFAYFDRIWPEKELSKHHPYIRSRAAQIEATQQAADPDMDLMILELPYIFGAMPGRTPLWAPLVRYIRYPFPLLYPGGGSNAVSVKRVAEAIVGAVERGQGGEIYQVGDENLTWVDLLTRLGAAAGLKKRIITLPNWIVRLGMGIVEQFIHFQGKEGGLDLVRFSELQTSETFFDPSPTREALGYGSGGLDEALRETVEAC
jgi:nucleoside-diphosphate-sugar epimerase